MRPRLPLLACAAALTLGACAASSHPAPDPAPATRPAVSVAAPASRTREAALAIMKQDGAEFQDRAASPLVTKELTIPFRYQGVASDCGPGSVSANQVVMAVHVGGDEQRSTVQVTGRFYLRGVGPIRYCETKHFWESNLEERIRDRAEGR